MKASRRAAALFLHKAEESGVFALCYIESATGVRHGSARWSMCRPRFVPAKRPEIIRFQVFLLWGPDLNRRPLGYSQARKIPKYIDISIYAYRSDAIKAKKAMSMAESLFVAASENDSGIGYISISFVSSDSTVEVANFDSPLYIPVIILTILKTTTTEGETIWISDQISSITYENSDIFDYEYDASSIFGSIDIENYCIEDTNFSDDLIKALF